ncbi:MAG TPA: hypothetical protein PK970_04270 [Hyphomicrobiaceae bacterium]|nr:hypothetical protein [Hyphomicrobiaceae bacterium]
MSRHISPYHAPGFYQDALAKGRHRDIVGGRWEETGRVQMALLVDAGLAPQHVLLDIGAGSLRLGCKAVPYLDPGNYWATDMSGALLRKGYDAEITDKARLPREHLVEDKTFEFVGIPASVTHAIAFAVFTHLPMNFLRRALISVHGRFPKLDLFLFTVFLAPDATSSLLPVRQPDGAVTHDTRAPYHMLEEDVRHLCAASGFEVARDARRLPRGQVLFVARRR